MTPTGDGRRAGNACSSITEVGLCQGWLGFDGMHGGYVAALVDDHVTAPIAHAIAELEM